MKSKKALAVVLASSLAMSSLISPTSFAATDWTTGSGPTAITPADGENNINIASPTWSDADSEGNSYSEGKMGIISDNKMYNIDLEASTLVESGGKLTLKPTSVAIPKDPAPTDDDENPWDTPSSWDESKTIQVPVVTNVEVTANADNTVNVGTQTINLTSQGVTLPDYEGTAKGVVFYAGSSNGFVKATLKKAKPAIEVTGKISFDKTSVEFTYDNQKQTVPFKVNGTVNPAITDGNGDPVGNVFTPTSNILIYTVEDTKYRITATYTEPTRITTTANTIDKTKVYFNKDGKDLVATVVGEFPTDGRNVYATYEVNNGTTEAPEMETKEVVFDTVNATPQALITGTTVKPNFDGTKLRVSKPETDDKVITLADYDLTLAEGENRDFVFIYDNTLYKTDVTFTKALTLPSTTQTTLSADKKTVTITPSVDGVSASDTINTVGFMNEFGDTLTELTADSEGKITAYAQIVNNKTTNAKGIYKLVLTETPAVKIPDGATITPNREGTEGSFKLSAEATPQSVTFITPLVDGKNTAYFKAKNATGEDTWYFAEIEFTALVECGTDTVVSPSWDGKKATVTFVKPAVTGSAVDVVTPKEDTPQVKEYLWDKTETFDIEGLKEGENDIYVTGSDSRTYHIKKTVVKTTTEAKLNLAGDTITLTYPDNIAPEKIGVDIGLQKDGQITGFYKNSANQIYTSTFDWINPVALPSTIKASVVKGNPNVLKLSTATNSTTVDLEEPLVEGENTVFFKLEDKVYYTKVTYGEVTKAPTTVTKSNVTYKITGNKKCSVTKIKNKSSITILKTVKIGNVTCKVTSIAKNAMKGKSKVKTVKIKTTYLTSIGANAFKGINKKAKYYVVKSKYKKYKKLITKKSTGYKKTQTVKKS